MNPAGCHYFRLGFLHREMSFRDKAMLRSAFLWRYYIHITPHSEAGPETVASSFLNLTHIWMATRQDGEPFSLEQEAYLAGFMTALRMLEANPVDGQKEEEEKECV